MKAEIAPSYKFKLAVNRGLPYLIPHGFSGELLPRRCTIAVLPLLLWAFRQTRLRFRCHSLAQLSYVAYLRSSLFSLLNAVKTSFAQLSSFLWHCPHPHGHLGFPSKLLFRLPGLSSLKKFKRVHQSTFFTF